jgi:hypothetical protein
MTLEGAIAKAFAQSDPACYTKLGLHRTDEQRQRASGRHLHKKANKCWEFGNRMEPPNTRNEELENEHAKELKNLETKNL